MSMLIQRLYEKPPTQGFLEATDASQGRLTLERSTDTGATLRIFIAT